MSPRSYCSDPGSRIMTDLEEILQRNGLSRTGLQRECPRETRVKIALKVTDWKVFGHIIGLSRERIVSVERENSTEDQRKVALLESWYEKDSKNATSLKLAEALRDHQRGDLIDHLCQLTVMCIGSESDNGFSQAPKSETTAAGIKEYSTMCGILATFLSRQTAKVSTRKIISKSRNPCTNST